MLDLEQLRFGCLTNGAFVGKLYVAEFFAGPLVEGFSFFS
jgi:hypothetical protein